MIIAAALFQVAAVTIPYSWLEYCGRSRDPGCVVETITPLDLAYLNMLVTEVIQPDPAVTTYAAPDDPWLAFPVDRHGDCDDRVVTARAALIALGLDPKKMTIETGEVTEPDGSLAGHAVLIVELDGRKWRMDSKTPDKLYPAEQWPYAWRPLARQPTAGIVWPNE